jgi:hypothetical protein
LSGIERRRLGADEIARFASPYLNGGRKQESWRLDAVEIEDGRLLAEVSMRSTYVSDTDSKGFHLSIFSMLEFLSQLMIIYMHVWAGLHEKSREAWMVESRTRSVRALRNPARIQVEMTVRKMRRRGVNLYCTADFRVTDDQGGLSEVQLKGFVA